MSDHHSRERVESTRRFSRRTWLAGACAAILATARSFAGPPASQLGFSLYGMKSLPLDDALKTCAEIGYRGVELALMPGYHAEPKALTAEKRRELRGRLGELKLSLAALMENLAEPAEGAVRAANEDRLKAAAELGHALSPDAPPVIETVLGGKPAQWEGIKDRVADRMKAWAEIGRAAKTVIAVKPHVANALHTLDGAAWLIKQVSSPWLRLAFDYSHFVLRGIDMKKAVEVLIPLSAFVHVKDARGTPEKFEFLLPGDGTIDYAAYYKQLRATRYAGPIVVEVSGQISGRAGYDPRAAARQCFERLSQALK